MKITRNLKNQQGVSLVEVLGGIVILSFVGILLLSIISSGQKQYTNQSEKNQELKDISYKLKVLTKDIRKAESVKSNASNSFTVRFEDGEEVIYSYTPPQDGKPGKLFKSTDVDDFLTIDNEEGNKDKDDYFKFYVIDDDVKRIEIQIQDISTKIVVRE